MILPIKGKENYEINVKLPEICSKVVNKPVSFGDLSSVIRTSQDFTASEGKLTLRYAVSTGEKVITVGDYGQARQAAVSLLKVPARMLVLEEKKK